MAHRTQHFLLTLALAAVTGAAVPLGMAAAPQTAAPAANFTLKSVGGENLRLSEYRGEVVLLVFWATWCNPCRQQLAEVDRIYREHRAAGFTVLAVALDDDTTKAKIVARDMNLEFPVLFDSGKRVSDLYAIDTLPAAFLIDRDGILRFVHPGYRPGEENVYATQIRRLLAE